MSVIFKVKSYILSRLYNAAFEAGMARSHHLHQTNYRYLLLVLSPKIPRESTLIAVKRAIEFLNKQVDTVVKPKP